MIIAPPPSQAYETISMAHKHSAEGADFLDFFFQKSYVEEGFLSIKQCYNFPEGFIIFPDFSLTFPEWMEFPDNSRFSLTFQNVVTLQLEFWPTRNFDLCRYHCSQCYSESVFR